MSVVAFKLLQCFATAGSFFIAPHLPFFGMVIVIASALLVGFVSYVVLSRLVRLDAVRSDDSATTTVAVVGGPLGADEYGKLEEGHEMSALHEHDGDEAEHAPVDELPVRLSREIMVTTVAVAS